MALNLTKFLGLAPRINSRAAGPNLARKAIDVDLDNGTIRPWREGKLMFTADHDILSFAHVGCCWLTWDKCVDLVFPYTPSCPFVIVTGAAAYPQIATAEDACAGEWCRLGVPCPPAAPIMSFTPVAVNVKTAARGYRYTYVNKYAQEGGGSAPSQVEPVQDGQTVTVTGFECPDPEWCVISIRLYRLGTPFETGLEESNPQNTEYFFVAEFPCTQATYVDTILDINLGGPAGPNVFTNDEYLPAPADLRNIVSMENGILAGISGDAVWMSEPNSPHAWLLRYTKGFFDKPVALAAIGPAMFVATDGRPYLVDGKNNCKGDGCAQVLRTPVPLPCISRRSMVAESGVCYYASTTGLVALGGTSAKVISQQHLSERDWQDLRPNTMIGAFRNGYYHGYTENFGMRYRGPESEFDNQREIAFTHLTERPSALWRAENGELYYAVGREVFHWNGGDRFKVATWASNETFFARRTTLGSGAIDRTTYGNTRFLLTTDYGVVLDRLVNDSKEFRLPGLANAEFASVEVQTTAEVRQITVGTTIAARLASEGLRAA